MGTPATMKKKPPIPRFPKPKAVALIDDRTWHNGGDIEIGLYARSLHKAAKILIANCVQSGSITTGY